MLKLRACDVRVELCAAELRTDELCAVERPMRRRAITELTVLPPLTSRWATIGLSAPPPPDQMAGEQTGQ